LVDLEWGADGNVNRSGKWIIHQAFVTSPWGGPASNAGDGPSGAVSVDGEGRGPLVVPDELAVARCSSLLTSVGVLDLAVDTSLDEREDVFRQLDHVLVGPDRCPRVEQECVAADALHADVLDPRVAQKVLQVYPVRPAGRNQVQGDERFSSLRLALGLDLVLLRREYSDAVLGGQLPDQIARNLAFAHVQPLRGRMMPIGIGGYDV
jgi:hypothetical protein